MNYEDCPICGVKMHIERYYLDERILLEEYHKCVNPKCSQYFYEYVTGYSSIHIVSGDSNGTNTNSTHSTHIKNRDKKHYSEWEWAYNTEEAQREKTWKEADAYINEMKVRYRAKYGPYDNPILDYLEID